MAKKEYLRLKEDMTQEEIDVVTLHLNKNSMIVMRSCSVCNTFSAQRKHPIFPKTQRTHNPELK